jgi:hypothetical protein
MPQLTELDLELGPEVLELIEDFGKEVVFEVLPVGIYDKAERKNTTVPVTVTTKMLPEDYKLGQSTEAGLVEVGDKKLYVAALAFASKPTSQDKAKFDGQTWIVLSVIEYMSGERAALYEVQVRRS